MISCENERTARLRQAAASMPAGSRIDIFARHPVTGVTCSRKQDCLKLLGSAFHFSRLTRVWQFAPPSHQAG